VDSTIGGVFDRFHLKDAVLNDLKTLELRAPARGFDPDYVLGGNHLTITREFIDSLAAKGAPFITSTLGRALMSGASGGPSPLKPTQFLLRSSWTLPSFVDDVANSSVSVDFPDGTFERTASLDEASHIDVSGITSPDASAFPFAEHRPDPFRLGSQRRGILFRMISHNRTRPDGRTQSANPLRSALPSHNLDMDALQAGEATES
jgi:hypothetical protein